ncbi:MAG: hypothetical protein AAB815_02495 [Patescibacteria group bacterium]
MFPKILHFIKYNNLTAIIFSVIFSGVGVTLAASPEARAGVYSSSQMVTSIDNRLIIGARLDDFDFNLKITSITEDDENYYAAYSYQTLAIEDSVWKNVNLNKTLEVEKTALEDKDLGLYLAEELSENINYELSYLRRVQELEKEKGKSQKVVTTEYSGLIGKFLDPEEKVIEGYEPVIPEIEEEETEDVLEPQVKGASTAVPEGSVSAPAEQGMSEQEVRRIIDQYLAEQKAQADSPEEAPAPDPEPTPPPEEAPAPDPEPTPPPEEAPAPDPAPDPVPPPEETPAPEETVPAELDPTLDPVPEPQPDPALATTPGETPPKAEAPPTADF